MCLSPVHIYNQKKCIELSPSTHFNLEVSCGKCLECQQARMSEYSLRGYFESLDCIRKGGFVYFDTLTYSPANLPRLSRFFNGLPYALNFPCFSRHDIKKFLARLRVSLARSFDIPSCAFRYLIASEYGTHPHHQHRPHYHVLFFVHSDKITPFEFSRLVSSSWCLGRTDGLPYRSSTYVLNHVSGRMSLCEKPFFLLTSYVSKYIYKKSLFASTVEKRISTLCDCLLDKSCECSFNPDGFVDPVKVPRLADIILQNKDDAVKCLTRILLHECSEFHLQSNGFGIYALKCVTVNDLIRTGCFLLPDYDKVVRSCAIPLYYRRKIFYDLVYDFRGMPVWQLNSKGLEFQKVHMNKRVDDLALKLNSYYLNCSPVVRSSVDELMNDRSFRDLSIYLLFYKGRLYYRREDVPYPSRYIDVISKHYPFGNVRYNYSNGKENGVHFVSTEFLGDSVSSYFDLKRFNQLQCLTLEVSDFCKRYCIDDNFFTEFMHFDSIYHLLLEYRSKTYYAVTGASRLKERLNLIHSYK